MNLKLFLLLPLLIILLHWHHPTQAEDCPPNADPSYCAIASETGGKVYSGTAEENFNSLDKDIFEEIRADEKVALIAKSNHFFTDILNGFTFFLPALIGFFLLEIFIRIIKDKRIFAVSYSICNAIPPLIFYFKFIDGGRGLPMAFAFAGIFFLIATWPIGYHFFKKRIPLYIGVTILALFTLFPIFMMLHMH